MPATVDKYRIGRHEPGIDNRVVLTDTDRIEIMVMREKGSSLNVIAKAFGVSRRIVQFILSPEKLEQNLLRREERGGSSKYYDKDKQREYMRTYRQHKREMLDNKIALERV